MEAEVKMQFQTRSQPQSKRMIIHDERHTKEALSMLEKTDNLSPESLLSIVEKAGKIIEHSVDPLTGPPESPSDGLLYGSIQSGKTSIITVTAAMAADNGFRCIIILTSDINPLYGQTLERIGRALRGLEVLGKKDWEEPTRFERRIRTSPFVVVCSKNPKTLHGLLEAFKAAGGKGATGLATMIIDDEGDQASLNTYTSKGAAEISRINELITKFRDFFPVNTYLQVTATPQALFLQSPNHRYRPSFTVLSEPGAGYIGGEAFFGSASKLLRSVDLEEVDLLRSTHQPSPTHTVPPGLAEALYCFFAGATAKIIQNPAENYSFLCHISHTRVDHRHIVNLIDRFKEETMNGLQDPSSSRRMKIEANLREAYDDISGTQAGLPGFEEVFEKFKQYLPGAKIKLIDSSSDEAITPDRVYNIFVGGNKLSRGVTIKNLLVSYYGRNPKQPNSDTVLQHARMYGYREKNIGVTRLFLPDKLAEHFRLIHQMESALRDLVKKYPHEKFEGLYISSPLQATRRNVLDPNSIGYYVAGKSYNPIYPLRTKDTAPNTEWLDAKLEKFGDRSRGREVTVDFITGLLEKCVPDPQHKSEIWDANIIRVALEKLKLLKGDKAYVVVRRRRDLEEPRRETRQIISDDEGGLAPTDAPTLFIFRQNANKKGEIAVWWPQLRFPEGNYVLAFSFNR